MRASAPNIFAGDKQLATREFVLSLFSKMDNRMNSFYDNNTNTIIPSALPPISITDVYTFDSYNIIASFSEDFIEQNINNPELILAEYLSLAKYSVQTGDVIIVTTSTTNITDEINKLNGSYIVNNTPNISLSKFVDNHFQTITVNNISGDVSGNIKLELADLYLDKQHKTKMNAEIFDALSKIIPSSILDNNSLQIYDSSGKNIIKYVTTETLNDISAAISADFNNISSEFLAFTAETNSQFAIINNNITILSGSINSLSTVINDINDKYEILSTVINNNYNELTGLILNNYNELSGLIYETVDNIVVENIVINNVSSYVTSSVTNITSSVTNITSSVTNLYQNGVLGITEYIIPSIVFDQPTGTIDCSTYGDYNVTYISSDTSYQFIIDKPGHVIGTNITIEDETQKYVQLDIGTTNNAIIVYVDTTDELHLPWYIYAVTEILSGEFNNE